MSEKNTDSHLARNVAIGAAGALAAAATVAAIKAWRTRKIDQMMAADYDPAKGEIFKDTRLEPGLRWLMAKAAVRLYVATYDTGEEVLFTQAQLHAMLGGDQQQLGEALGHLVKAELIASKTTVEGDTGYQALPPLEGALNQGEESVLHDAMYQLEAGIHQNISTD